MKQKILAIDYGTKKIGLAISDEDREYSSALPLLFYKKEEQALQAILEIVNHHQVKKIIIGLPLSIDQKPTRVSELVLEFKHKLQSKISNEIEIEEWNESMTTKQAQDVASIAKYKRKNIDGEAARIMLQEYLDFQRSGI